jgi:hypothetical protein
MVAGILTAVKCGNVGLPTVSRFVLESDIYS